MSHFSVGIYQYNCSHGARTPLSDISIAFYKPMNIAFNDCELDAFSGHNGDLPYLSFSNTVEQTLELNKELQDYKSGTW
jgi:hypothetical protein